jgi:phosphatidylserine decarboxylase
MYEASSIDLTVSEGQHVPKGDQLGMFHFGGSTECMLFRPGVNLQFQSGIHTPSETHSVKEVKLGEKVATVLPRQNNKDC